MASLKQLYWGILFLLLSACTSPTESTFSSMYIIHLKWNQSYPNEEITNALLGLNWCYSHLGATNTRTVSNGIAIQDQVITVDTRQLGFSPKALQSLTSLHQVIFASEEYRVNQTIDLGRYITLLIGAASHYYKITDIPIHLSSQLAPYNLVPNQGYITHSAIGNHHRLIQFAHPADLRQLWVSTEIDSVNGQVREIETMELMVNGQFKFAIYNADSMRISAPEHASSNAGKPAKCMWCHESRLNPLFTSQRPMPDFLDPQVLQDTLMYFRDQLSQRQRGLIDGVDFTALQAHAQMELQYLMFKHPSNMRLANEWQLTPEDVDEILGPQPMWVNQEFSFLLPGYARELVEVHAPVRGLPTSTFVREKSSVEVDYIE